MLHVGIVSGPSDLTQISSAINHDQHPVMKPISVQERLLSMDVLRGVAILGILTVNVYLYGHPYLLDYVGYLKLIGEDPQSRAFDRFSYTMINFLFQESLYCLFAFLFALGMASLMLRAERAGVSFGRFYVRRLLVLMVIGACHVLFLWAGDILITYSILGLLLLLFRRRSPTMLLVWAGVCLSATTAGFTGLVLMTRLLAPAGPAYSQENHAVHVVQNHSDMPALRSTDQPDKPGSSDDFTDWARVTSAVYAHGSYIQVLIVRVMDYLTWTIQLVFLQYPRVLGMFLLGLYAGRKKIIQDLPAHHDFIHRVGIWTLILAVAGGLASILMRQADSWEYLSWYEVVAMVGDAIRIPSMALLLVVAIILLVEREWWAKRLRALAAIGRMSLSNYLLQSLVCTTLFYGYGLGLYGWVGPLHGLLLSAGIFVVQLLLSVLWLHYFRFGPMEWIWRTLTYRRRQPMLQSHGLCSG